MENPMTSKELAKAIIEEYSVGLVELDIITTALQKDISERKKNLVRILSETDNICYTLSFTPRGLLLIDLERNFTEGRYDFEDGSIQEKEGNLQELLRNLIELKKNGEPFLFADWEFSMVRFDSCLTLNKRERRYPYDTEMPGIRFEFYKVLGALQTLLIDLEK